MKNTTSCKAAWESNEKSDPVRLAASGHALAQLMVRGRASHAGNAPGRGDA